MKSNARRMISLLLVVCMVAAMLPWIQTKVNAVTPNYSVSSAYKASKFYTALLNVELTGNYQCCLIPGGLP